MSAHLRRPTKLLLVVVILAAAVLGVTPTRGDAQASGCPAVGTNFAGTGPFSVTSQSDATNTFFSPTNLGSNGCTTHPVILWGNGTSASVALYDGLLRHYASHGFIVAAANTSNAGSGTQMLQGLATLRNWNGQAGHRFNGRVDLANVGSTGHSQGGGGAINAAKDQGVKTTAPLQPWSGNQIGLQDSDTALFFAGASDTIVSPTSVRGRYTGVSIAAGYAELAGASHFVPLGNAGGFRGPSTAWFRWQLMGDATARGQFVGANPAMASNPQWTRYETNARLQALDGGGGGPTTSTTGPSGAQCLTATNSAHVQAGRATSFLIFAWARGSSDYLGLTFSTTSLQGSGASWELVESC
jgi:Chlorophyllase enzyme